MKTPLLLAILLGSTASLFAQEPPPPPDQGQGSGDSQTQRGPQGHRPPPPPLIIALDANKDGVISADEIANAPAALKALDKNGDGQLTKEEFAPKPPPRPKARNEDSDDKSTSQRRPPPASPIVKALDADKDRVISAAEITGAPTALATLDKDGDGQLAKGEFAPKPPRRPHHGPSDPKPEPSATPGDNT